MLVLIKRKAKHVRKTTDMTRRRSSNDYSLFNKKGDNLKSCHISNKQLKTCRPLKVTKSWILVKNMIVNHWVEIFQSLLNVLRTTDVFSFQKGFISQYVNEKWTFVSLLKKRKEKCQKFFKETGKHFHTTFQTYFSCVSNLLEHMFDSGVLL